MPAGVGAPAGAELRDQRQEKTRGRSSQEEIGVEVSAGVETIWETERRAPGILLYFYTLSTIYYLDVETHLIADMVKCKDYLIGKLTAGIRT